MKLFDKLKQAKSEEDIKDAYIQALGLKEYSKNLIDIQTKAVAEYSDKLNMLALFDQTDKNWLFNFEKKLVK